MKQNKGRKEERKDKRGVEKMEETGMGAGRGGEERRERGLPLGHQQLATIWRCIVIGQQFIWE